VSTGAGITEAIGRGIARPDSLLGSTGSTSPAAVQSPLGRRVDGVIGLNTQQGRAVSNDGRIFGRAVYNASDVDSTDDPETAQKQSKDSGNLLQ